MDILDWILTGVLSVIFLSVLFYTFREMLKNRRFYVEKSKNVTPMRKKKRSKNVLKS